MRNHRRHGDIVMTEGPIGRQLITFSLPLLLGNLFQQFYNTADSIIVGNFVGKEALAAVGSTGSIIFMVVGFMGGLSLGATVVISQYYGARDYKKLHDAVHTTMLVTLISSVVFIGVGIALVNPMLRFMNTPADVFDEAEIYLKIYFAGLPGLIVYNMGSGILRAVGDSKRPLYFLCFCTVFNIAFDLLFVVAFHWGVAGVAYATILAEFLSAVLTWWVLAYSQTPYQLHARNLKIDGPILKRIIGIGFPTAIQQGLTCFSNVYVQSYVNAFGSTCMAGWSACNKIDQFVTLPVQSLGMAITTFVGQNLGAKQAQRAKEGVRACMWIGLAVTVGLTALLNLFARGSLRMFTQEDAVLRYGVLFVRLISPFYLALCVYTILAGALRGAGVARAPMLIMLFSFVAFRQAYLFTVAKLGNSLNFIALGYPVGWVVCTILLVVCYYRCPVFKREGRIVEGPREA